MKGEGKVKAKKNERKIIEKREKVKKKKAKGRKCWRE